MSTLDCHRPKFHAFYKQVAESAAQQSVAQRSRVGAVIVPTTGMLASGWNGMPSGFPNACELQDDEGEFVRDDNGNLITNPLVIHAERNALDKCLKTGVSVEHAMVFITLSPCVECAKSLYQAGVKAVFYREEYRDLSGVEFLRQTSVLVGRWDEAHALMTEQAAQAA